MRQASRLRPLAWWSLVLAGAFAAQSAWAEVGLAQPEGDLPDQVRGEQVYAATCATCHGPSGQGRPGEGIEAGPPVVGLEAAYVDQLMRTGRMPIRADRLGVNRDQLTDDEREAALAWMVDALDLVGQIPTVGEGDRVRGHELYAIHCSACHGATGQGGVGAGGTIILGITGLDPIAIAEAIRVGPFDMPRFDEQVLDDDDVDSIVAFATQDLTSPPTTPLGIAEMHRVAFWGMASAVGLALLGIVVVVARAPRVPGRVIEEREP